MPGVLLHHLPLPNAWPRRLRPAVVQVVSLAGASTAALRAPAEMPQQLSLVHYTLSYSNDLSNSV